MSVITCPSCGTPAPPGAIFCDHCGYDLRTIAPATPPMTSASPVPAPQNRDGDIVCSNCQHINLAGSAFCENCGAQLIQPSREPQPPKPSTWQQPVIPSASKASSVPPPVSPQPTSDSISGRLVIQESQISLPIPAGKQEIILGREDPVSGVFPDIDLDPYGGHEAGVGRRHARLVIKGGQVYLEDLDSVNGTAINRQRIPAHQSVPLVSEDEIRLGKMALRYFAS
jgi:pSer/pThr/pTyr-binding forkhead associated (FHA) protein